MHDWDSPHRFQFCIMSRIIFKPVNESWIIEEGFILFTSLCRKIFHKSWAAHCYEFCRDVLMSLSPCPPIPVMMTWHSWHFCYSSSYSQAKRDNQALTRSEQEVLATRRENDNLHTVIETLKQQNKNLQIEKDTEVEALSSQVCTSWTCHNSKQHVFHERL